MFFRKKYDYVQLDYPYNDLGHLLKKLHLRKETRENAEATYDMYREAVRENRPESAQKRLERTKDLIQNAKDSKASLAAMPNYAEIDRKTRREPVKELIPLFPFINWVNHRMNGGESTFKEFWRP
jgi:acyl-CoA reductase-like NAD-dependent aldehyde dehydrogenase